MRLCSVALIKAPTRKRFPFHGCATLPVPLPIGPDRAGRRQAAESRPDIDGNPPGPDVERETPSGREMATGPPGKERPAAVPLAAAVALLIYHTGTV